MESLRQHFRRLHDNAPSKQKESHMCEICAKIYSSKSGLEKHLEAHTDISETRAQCNICGKWLKNATYVRVHIRRIHDTVHQPIACPQCGKIKPHERSLKRHILECHTEANHKCNRCDKSFIYPVLLKVCHDWFINCYYLIIIFIFLVLDIDFCLLVQILGAYGYAYWRIIIYMLVLSIPIQKQIKYV